MQRNHETFDRGRQPVKKLVAAIRAKTRVAAKTGYLAGDDAASAFVSLYNTRKALAKLGYNDPMETLDVPTAQALLIVESTLQKMEAEERKKAQRASQPRRRR